MNITDTVRRMVRTLTVSKLTRAQNKLRAAVKLMEEANDTYRDHMLGDLVADTNRQELARLIGFVTGVDECLEELVK